MNERTETHGSRAGSARPEEGAGTAVIELLLREPEIVAWLEPDDALEDGDDEPPQAA